MRQSSNLVDSQTSQNQLGGLRVLELTMPKNEKVEVLRLITANQRPYFSSEIFALNLIERPELPMLATDQYFRLYWSEKALEEYDAKQKVAIFLQCMYPLLLDHAPRAKRINADSELWWIAANMEIACLLDDDGWQLPEGTPFPKQFKFEDGQIAEVYYRLLEDEAEKHGKKSVLNKAGIQSFQTQDGDGQEESGGENQNKRPNPGSSVDGEQKSWEENYSEENGLNESEKTQIQQAVAEAAKTIGKLPAGLARWAKALTEYRIDWKKETRSLMRNAIEMARGIGDYSYSKFRRRAPIVGVMLPASVQHKLKIAVVIDTSGSMSDSEISEALTEVNSILKNLPTSDGAYVVCVDAAVHSAKKVFDASQIEVKGRGGTDVTVGIDYALQKRPRPDVIVLITDGFTPYPKESVGIPIICVIVSQGTTNGIPSWMKVVKITKD